MRALLIYASAALGGLGLWGLCGFDPIERPDTADGGYILSFVLFLCAGAASFWGGTYKMLPPLFPTRTTLDESLDDLQPRL